jgi:hypothetical protein
MVGAFLPSVVDVIAPMSLNVGYWHILDEVHSIKIVLLLVEERPFRFKSQSQTLADPGDQVIG